MYFEIAELSTARLAPREIARPPNVRILPAIQHAHRVTRLRTVDGYWGRKGRPP